MPPPSPQVRRAEPFYAPPPADRRGRADPQGGAAYLSDTPEGGLWDWSQARRGLRLRTLILLRWISTAAQAAALILLGLAFGFRAGVVAALLVVGATIGVNYVLAVGRPQTRIAGRREALVQLGLDIAELTAVLALTGGLQNPFSPVLIAPVCVAAATLERKEAALVGVLALAAVSVLYFVGLPLPWMRGGVLDLPVSYQVGLWIGTATSIAFAGLYAWQAQAEAGRMELALAATQAVLAREQRLSALGGLAAAAAHELGTPLATIQVVTKEMLRELPEGQVREDVELLAGQAERCREILRKLSRSPEASDVRHDRMSLSQLMEEISEPHRSGPIDVEPEVSCAVGASILEVKRLPEVLHGLSAFVENAVDFAESLVEVSAYYDADKLVIDVRDDGPGFPADVLGRLGEPYVTTRPNAENSRSHHQGMGLGFFIAKTLLERTGGQVEFRNARRGGAVISTRWPRRRVEAEAVEL
ncbi:MAG: ActS/PrrB/RegB family redox-sensitive histidine kinase [Caulobacteraceae bacterium]|nr:ActS/PrrB/RegB family redox-sensitive histidine kinase [Caulobacter sp.]